MRPGLWSSRCPCNSAVGEYSRSRHRKIEAARAQSAQGRVCPSLGTQSMLSAAQSSESNSRARPKAIRAGWRVTDRIKARTFAVLGRRAVTARWMSSCGSLACRPIGEAERTILLDALTIMLAIVLPTLVATLAFAWRFRASNTQCSSLAHVGLLRAVRTHSSGQFLRLVVFFSAVSPGSDPRNSTLARPLDSQCHSRLKFRSFHSTGSGCSFTRAGRRQCQPVSRSRGGAVALQITSRVCSTCFRTAARQRDLLDVRDE